MRPEEIILYKKAVKRNKHWITGEKKKAIEIRNNVIKKLNKEYEYLCPECDGWLFFADKQSDGECYWCCEKCHGRGKFDWLELIMGIKNYWWL